MTTPKRTMGILIGILFLLISCNNTETEIKPVRQKIIVKYSNGNIYCEGMYLLDKETNTPSHYVGIWKYYYQNGELDRIIELDETGELVNYKKYWLNGILKSASITKDNITFSSFFNEDGKLVSETITRVETYTNYEGEDESETSFTTNKLYYDNNQLKREWNEVDDEYIGIDKMWDENGNLILSIEYKNGFIVTDSIN